MVVPLTLFQIKVLRISLAASYVKLEMWEVTNEMTLWWVIYQKENDNGSSKKKVIMESEEGLTSVVDLNYKRWIIASIHVCNTSIYGIYISNLLYTTISRGWSYSEKKKRKVGVGVAYFLHLYGVINYLFLLDP